MKISPATYQQMLEDVSAVFSAHGIDPAADQTLSTLHQALAVVSRNRAYDDSHPAFTSGAWRRVLPFDGRDYCWFYAGGCNDTHVATALKAIRKDLIEKQALAR